MAIITEQRVPPLAAGDQLTREEFLRRWEADPSIKLAELIGGIVYMPSPVSVDHGEVHAGWEHGLAFTQSPPRPNLWPFRFPHKAS